MNNVFILGTVSTALYKDTRVKIEKLSELFAHAMFVTSITSMVPSLLYTIVAYYILDLGKESFVVFFPTWFVLTMR